VASKRKYKRRKKAEETKVIKPSSIIDSIPIHVILNLFQNLTSQFSGLFKILKRVQDDD